LKIDPDVPAEAEAVAAEWRQRGWRPSPEQIQFPNTMVSDLSGGRDALWAGLKQKTRYNIRLAERRDVRVRRGGEADLATFYGLYAATAARAPFAIRSREYYLDAWTMFLRQDRAAVLLAEREGRALAGVIPVAFGDTAWFLYGASADEGREHMPAYLAQWASLEWAIERGCRAYDWWGGPTRLEEDDPLWGVYRFKEGFGARWRPQLGAWDYPSDPARAAAYQALSRLRALYLALRRRGG
jgi:lipid II:glycine glycyltransferase (peptidoglycan interpeptide bridge formation enzyme)